MVKYLLITCSILFCAVNAQAQYLSASNSNPFNKLQFLNKPTDTITLVVDYNNIIGGISENHKNMMAVIAKNSGSNVTGFNNAIGFTIPGYPQKFYVPCKDDVLFNQLSSKQKTVSKLKLSCVVYRFYYMDSTYNFFYIDKGSIVN